MNLYKSLVATIIPTHNRADLVGQAIESVIAQNRPDDEILVVDDDSTDDTEAVIRSYSRAAYLKIRSGKPSATRNAGIRATTAKYIAFLDDDDLWKPERLSPAVELLERQPEIGMVYAQATMMTSNLDQEILSFPPLPLAEGHPVAEFLDNVVHLDTVLVRRSVLDEVGLLDESVYGAEDMDLTVRIARAYRVAALPYSVAVVRRRAADAPVSVKGATATWLGRARDEFYLLRKHLSIQDEHRPSMTQRIRIVRRRRGWYAHMLLDTARTALREDDTGEARAALMASLRIAPLHTLRNPSFAKLLVMSSHRFRNCFASART
jgi:glycosyltransferase involved in cell wall biosynthesis